MTKPAWNNLSTEFRVIGRHMNTLTTPKQFLLSGPEAIETPPGEAQAPKTFFDQGQTLPTLTE